MGNQPNQSKKQTNKSNQKSNASDTKSSLQSSRRQSLLQKDQHRMKQQDTALDFIKQQQHKSQPEPTKPPSQKEKKLVFQTLAQSMKQKGDQTLSKGTLEDALTYYQQALSALISLKGQKSIQYAEGLNFVGNSLSRYKHFQKAEGYYQKCLEIRGNSLGKRSLQYANSIYNIALLNNDWNKLEEALQGLDQAYEIYKQIQGAKCNNCADVINSMGLVNKKKGDYHEALNNFKDAYELKKQIQGEQSIVCANIVGNIGIVHYQLGQHQQALEFLFQSLAVRQKIRGGITNDTLAIRRTVAKILLTEEQYEKAQHYFQQCLQIAQKTKGKDSLIFAQILYQMSDATIKLNNIRQVSQALKKCLQIFQKFKGKQDIVIADILIKIGQIQYQQLDLQSALSYYKQALYILSKKQQKSLKYAQLVHKIGLVLGKQAKYTQALKHFYQSLSVVKDIQGQSCQKYIYMLRNLANFKKNHGQYTGALQNFQNILSLRQKINGKESVQYAKVVFQMGRVHEKQKDYQKAIQVYQSSLQKIGVYSGKDSLIFAKYLFNIGCRCLDIQLLDKAKTYLQQSLQLYKNLRSQFSDQYTNTLDKMALFYVKKGDLVETFQVFKKSYYLKIQYYDAESGVPGQIIFIMGSFIHTLQQNRQNSRYIGKYEAFSKYVLSNNGMNYQVSLQTLKRKLQIQQKGDENILNIDLMLEMAQVYAKMNDQDKAVAIYQKIIQNNRIILKSQDLKMSEIYHKLGWIYYKIRQYVKSCEYFRSSLKIIKQISGQKSIQYALGLDYLSMTQMSSSKYADILETINQSLRIKQALSLNSAQYAFTLLLRADLKHRQNGADISKQLKQIQKNYVEGQISDWKRKLQYLKRSMRLHLRLGNIQLAFKYSKEGYDLLGMFSTPEQTQYQNYAYQSSKIFIRVGRIKDALALLHKIQFAEFARKRVSFLLLKVWKRLSILYFQIGQPEGLQFIVSLFKAHQNYSTNVAKNYIFEQITNAFEQAGDVARYSGLQEEALKCYQYYINLKQAVKHQVSQVLAKKADLLMRKQHFEGALKIYQNIFKIDLKTQEIQASKNKQYIVKTKFKQFFIGHVLKLHQNKQKQYSYMWVIFETAANYMFSLQQYDDAAKIAYEVVSLTKNKSKIHSIDLLLARIHLKQLIFKQAKQFAKTYKKYVKQKYGKGGLLMMQALTIQAQISQKLRDTKNVISSYQKLLKIQNTITLVDNNQLLKIKYLVKVADYYRSIDLHSKALQSYKQGISFLEKIGSTQIQIAFLLDKIGDTQLQIQNQKQAFKAYQQSCQMWNKLKNPQSLEHSQTLFKIAELYLKTKNYPYALKTYQKYKQMIKKVKGQECQEVKKVNEKVKEVIKEQKQAQNINRMIKVQKKQENKANEQKQQPYE